MTQQGSNAKRASSTANWWLAYIDLQNIASFNGSLWGSSSVRHAHDLRHIAMNPN